MTTLPTQRASHSEGVVATAPPDFAQVYETYFDMVWANMRRLGVEASRVDDAVQDVFLAVHRRLGEFEGRASMKTWLFHFILRVASTHRRATRSANKVTQLPADRAKASANPERTVETQQAAEMLYRILDSLDDERRSIFVLVEFEELTTPEAAKMLGLNVNTAYSKLRDARRDFERALAREHSKEDWRAR